MILVLDNGPCHVSKATRRALAERADWLEVIPLARYSPHLNPKEHEWRRLKRDHRGHLAPTLRAFVDAAAAGLADARRRGVRDHRRGAAVVAGRAPQGADRPPAGPTQGRQGPQAPYPPRCIFTCVYLVVIAPTATRTSVTMQCAKRCMTISFVPSTDVLVRAESEVNGKEGRSIGSPFCLSGAGLHTGGAAGVGTNRRADTFEDNTRRPRSELLLAIRVRAAEPAHESVALGRNIGTETGVPGGQRAEAIEIAGLAPEVPTQSAGIRVRKADAGIVSDAGGRAGIADA